MEKEIIIIAGANGSGKTTFADLYHKKKGVDFINADLIAEGLKIENDLERFRTAGEIFLGKLEELVNGRDSFMIESTLSGRFLINTINKAKKNGFSIQLVYIFLDTPDLCVERIKERVLKGGHHVPEKDVKRRYYRSIWNFGKIYKNTADHWFLIHNSKQLFARIAMGIGEKYIVNNRDVFNTFLKYGKIDQ